MQIVVERGDNLEKFEQIYTEVVTGNLKVITETVHADAVLNSPTDQGFFKNSLTPDVVIVGDCQILGKIFSTMAHAGVIEGVDEQGNEKQYGRDPGSFPNFGALQGWIKRRNVLLSLPAGKPWVVELLKKPEDDQLRILTIIIGKRIQARGLPREGAADPHFRPMKRAAEKNRAFAEDILTKQVPLQIAERL